MLCRPLLRLASESDRASIKGTGVYAIYYTGEFPLYARISAANREGEVGWPIYVGKAIPKGGRIGGIGQAARATAAIRDRLRRHFQSVDAAVNLRAEDFSFRALVVDDVWIPLGENMLIETFRPLWNARMPGFGNNPTGGPRAGQRGSLWDALHPGRGGAGKPDADSVAEAAQAVRDYFTTRTE